MRIWYYDIVAGDYTMQEFIDLTEPKQKYQAVYNQFRRFKVKSYRLAKKDVDYNKKNEKIWQWEGAEFYLKGGNKSTQ